MRIGILTVSDRCFAGERQDRGGEVVAEVAAALGEVVERRLVPDRPPEIRRAIKDLVDLEACQVVLTTGGTGIGPRDVTPEATRAVIEKEIPGLAELMRKRSLEETPHAALSRALAGTRGRSLVVNLPGSPGGARTCLEAVGPALRHAAEMLEPGPQDCAGPLETGKAAKKKDMGEGV